MQWEASLLNGTSRLAGNDLLPSYRWADDSQYNGSHEDNPRAAYAYPDLIKNRLKQLTFNLHTCPSNRPKLPPAPICVAVGATAPTRM
ncbi:MAG TPA: hypothetical protein VJ577_00905 [Burkholderiaceae bacterium]|nr:hypothetical protein [Burkholderiaceae bacterium]